MGAVAHVLKVAEDEVLEDSIVGMARLFLEPFKFQRSFGGGLQNGVKVCLEAFEGGSLVSGSEVEEVLGEEFVALGGLEFVTI